jgi:predicted metal-dependent phosphoesterase TrpH
MFYDFHIHTREYSACAESPAEEICRAAMERGLDGIAVTEHDLWWPVAKLEALRKKFSDLIIIPGAEYSSPDGHFLVFLPELETAELPPGLGVLELLPEIHAHGGIVIWAHPFRWRKTIPGWLHDVALDGMEVASNNMDSLAQTSAL